MPVDAFPHTAHRILDTSVFVEAIPKDSRQDFIE
jgi:hypothetical protein